MHQRPSPPPPWLYSGFALVEGLLVIAILGILSGMGIPMYQDYRDRSNVALSLENVSQALSRAKLLSQVGEQDSEWGYSAGNGVLFKGTSYASRDPAFDESYPAGDGVSVSGPLEVWFTKGQGKPSSSGTITFQGKKSTRTLVIGTDGSIESGEDDTFQICHKPPGNPANAHTIKVSENAWPAHKKHGDTVGPCSGGCDNDDDDDGDDDDDATGCDDDDDDGDDDEGENDDDVDDDASNDDD